MNINIRGNKVKITEGIKNYVNSKLERINKYLDENKNADVKVIISVRGNDQKVEVTIWNGKYSIRAEETHNDLYAAIDLVIDKLEKQFRRYKDKICDKRRKEVEINEIPVYVEEETTDVVRRKEVCLKPVDEEEAITQMELLGHSFFVFKNVNTKKINVVYKRKNGDYGIIVVE